MKSFWNGPRVVALVALAVPCSAVAFAGVQYFDTAGASVSDCPAASACVTAVPTHLNAMPIRRLAPRPRPLNGYRVQRVATRAPRRVIRSRVAPITPRTPPTTCAGVVASIAWPPRWHVRCEGARSRLLGVTQPAGVTELFVRSDQTMAELRIVALHESGHAWDFARLGPRRIARWCAVRGCDPARFFSGGASGQGWAEPGGAEDWASAWDACHGGEYHRSYIGLGNPSVSQCAVQNRLTNYPR